jgi:hypothetical protein
MQYSSTVSTITQTSYLTQLSILLNSLYLSLTFHLCFSTPTSSHSSSFFTSISLLFLWATLLFPILYLQIQPTICLFAQSTQISINQVTLFLTRILSYYIPSYFHLLPINFPYQSTFLYLCLTLPSMILLSSSIDSTSPSLLRVILPCFLSLHEASLVFTPSILTHPIQNMVIKWVYYH